MNFRQSNHKGRDGIISALISVVTVAYNSEGTIAKTIESVLAQTYPRIEYIIIDGKSSDSTVSIAESYRAAFEAQDIIYRIVSEKDEGIYDAMNKGVALTTGEVVGLLNSDDWYEPIAAERVAAAYEREPFDLFYADLMIHKRSGPMVKKAKNKRFVSTRHWNHPTTFLRRPLYDQYQYRGETIYDDWDLILRVRRGGCKVVVLNEVLANFQFGGVSNERSFKKMRERLRIKYGIYRQNGYSRLYWLDCAAMEWMKYILS